jgi:hypothetical protein
MKRMDDGKPGCLNYEDRGRGCRLFPWHPDQLSNTERGDLPRVPIFNTAQPPTVTSREVPADNGVSVLYQELESKEVKREELKIIDWAPFSTVCSYVFVDVTDWFRSIAKKPKYVKETSPIVKYVHEADPLDK